MSKQFVSQAASNPSFHRLIPDADRRAIALAEEAIRSVTHLVLALHCSSVCCAQSRILGIRKTFSAGLRSFSCKETMDWPLRLKRKSAQPVFDSQLGRIAFKALSLRNASLFKLRRAAASNQSKGFLPTPIFWLAAALTNFSFSSFIAPSGHIRSGS